MGMFDSIYFKCPKCGALIEEQSKAGECVLHDYKQSAVPLVIAEDINGNRIYCPKCKTEWKIQASVIVNPIPMRLIEPD